MDPSLEVELQRAMDMHFFIVDQLAGEYARNDRRALFGAFLSLALSHHEAIITLAKEPRLVGSALALYRPLVEVAYRGLFTAFLANDEQVEQIRQGEEPFGRFNELAARLDSAFGTDDLFMQFGGSAWRV